MMPDFLYEEQYSGLVCGIDEVGRGPLAGPVVAACVIIPPEARNHDFLKTVQDSKKLSKRRRNTLNALILQSFPTSIAVIEIDEIDRLNILHASLKAMAQSLATLCKQHKVTHALVDGNRLPPALPCQATPIIKGDSKSVSIAAASIIAKVHRDAIMDRLANDYPQYGWNKNAGYPTADHLAALDRFGVTPHHRKSFAPVRNRLAKSA